MRMLSLVVIAAVSAGVGGAAFQASATAQPTPSEQCGQVSAAQLRTTLYFGTARPKGTVSELEWQVFLRDEVTTRFPDGLTVWDAQGQWRAPGGAIDQERSKVLLLVHADSARARAAILEVIASTGRPSISNRCCGRPLASVSLIACGGFLAALLMARSGTRIVWRPKQFLIAAGLRIERLGVSRADAVCFDNDLVSLIERRSAARRSTCAPKATSLRLTDMLDLLERGSALRLDSTLRVTGPDLSHSFPGEGQTYRFANVDTEVNVARRHRRRP